jgi:hypothetical protein
MTSRGSSVSMFSVRSQIACLYHRYKVAGLLDPGGPATIARAKRSCCLCFGSSDHVFSFCIMIMFTPDFLSSSQRLVSFVVIILLFRSIFWNLDFMLRFSVYV